MIEYVIWGKTPSNQSEEQILLSALRGQPITDIVKAEQWKERLASYHLCTDVRIQSIDLSSNEGINDFVNSINI